MFSFLDRSLKYVKISNLWIIHCIVHKPVMDYFVMSDDIWPEETGYILAEQNCNFFDQKGASVKGGSFKILNWIVTTVQFVQTI